MTGGAVIATPSAARNRSRKNETPVGRLLRPTLGRRYVSKQRAGLVFFRG
jgi:hypothetical protein